MSNAKRKTSYRRLYVPLAGVGVLLVLTILAPYVTAYDPIQMNIAERLRPPSWDNLLGQDAYGRDIFTRLLFGARVSLSVALLASAAAGVAGVTIGLVGGYFGGLVELLTIRLTDIILSFPPMLLALLIVTILGPGAETLTMVLAILYTPRFARVTYGEVLSIRELEYVEAARSLGAGPGRILFLTILPNISGPIIVQFSLTVAAAILIESGLSFLGLGVVPPDPSWGLMIAAARSYMTYTALPLLWPCMALVVTVLIINSLCDALRDFYDPKVISGSSPRTLKRLIDATVGISVTRKRETEAGQREALLSVDGLRTYFFSKQGIVKAVDEVSFEAAPGETVAVVGESGSGKSITGLSILRLVPKPLGHIVSGDIGLKGKDGKTLVVTDLDEQSLEDMRGEEVAMIFQEPMTSLNPVYRVGDQIAEAITRHRKVSKKEALEQARRMLEHVGIPDAGARIRDYPHQMSGGMRQRVMIASALSCRPGLLIADEPTTALDVTIQAQILDLLRSLHDESDGGFGMLFITHNLGVVAEIADRVLVMYHGRIVEEGDVASIFREPLHPYTKGLLKSIPHRDSSRGHREPLFAIPGTVPSPTEKLSGCSFAPRCFMAEPACHEEVPPLASCGEGRRSRCSLWRNLTS